MEMVPASKGDWGQSEGGQQQVSFVSGDEEHIYDDKEELLWHVDLAIKL